MRLILFVVCIAGCSGSKSSSSSSTSGIGKITKAHLSSGAKGLVHITGGQSASSMSVNGVTAQSSLSDSLLQVQLNGDLSEVTFTVDEGSYTFVTTVPVLATKTLTDTYVALKVDAQRTVLLNKVTGDTYDLPLVPDDMVMNGNNLYYLINGDGIGTGQLLRLDVTDPTLTTYNVNTIDGTAANTGMGPTAIPSMINDPSSPFRILGESQYGSGLYGALSPSFIFAGTSYIAAMAGPSGGYRVMLFQEGQSPYDCQMSTISNVGGGMSGGYMQASDKTIYQIQMVTNDMASNAGDWLVSYNVDTTGNCWTPNTVVHLASTSYFDNQPAIYFKVVYKLTDLTRYVLNPAGFLKTEPSGSSATMSWTALDLSSVPTTGSVNNKLVVVDGDYVYYLSGTTDIFYQHLVSGSSPALYYSSSDAITTFDIVGGQLVYSTASGSYSVPSAGGTRVEVSGGGSISDTVRF